MPVYPLSFETVRALTKGVAAERIVLNRPQVRPESSFSGKRQSVETFARWRLAFTLPRMSEISAQQVAAWMVSLQGGVGSFTYAPRNVGPALEDKALALDLHQYGNLVRLAGFAADIAPGDIGYRPGRWMQLGNQLHRITAVGAVVGGNVDFEFEPWSRATVFAAGTVAKLAAPVGLFEMEGDEYAGEAIDPDRLPEFAPLTALEVL